MPSATAGTKKCSTCHERKPLSSFNRRKDAKDGYNCVCKACRNKRDRNTRRASSRKGGSYITVTDAITPELRARLRPSQWTADEWYEYDRALAFANDCCEICRDDSPGTRNDVFQYLRDSKTFKMEIILCEKCYRDYVNNREKWCDNAHAWEMALRGWDPYLSDADAQKRAERESDLKECNLCHENKPRSMFNNSKRFEDNLRPECSSCTKEHYSARDVLQDDGTTVSVKVCNQCETEKEATKFSDERHSSDGYRHQCKACHRANAQQSVDLRYAKAKMTVEGKEQKCTGCDLTLPVEMFSKDRTTGSGRRAKCKVCINDLRRARRARQHEIAVN